jgi:flagellar biosynthesis/type III secretory pathway M-ring protein FliF/YscJ
VIASANNRFPKRALFLPKNKGKPKIANHSKRRFKMPLINILFFIVLFILLPIVILKLLADLNRAERKAQKEIEKLLINRVDIRRIK